jgi:hypothetical protein
MIVGTSYMVNFPLHSLNIRCVVNIDIRQNRELKSYTILLGHSKLQSKIEYLDVEIEDALSTSEEIDILKPAI